jgi:hypothetical protein
VSSGGIISQHNGRIATLLVDQEQEDLFPLVELAATIERQCGVVLHKGASDGYTSTGAGRLRSAT